MNGSWKFTQKGLAAKIDPLQKEKQDTRDWLNDCVDRLNIQVPIFLSFSNSIKD
jgi:CCR4-NOT transcriptional regulation complex NOT5 subunit